MPGSRQVKREVLWEGDFIRVIAKHFKDQHGGDHVWECVERKRTREIVVIFAVTKDREVVLCKQYRYPLDADIVELPAGLSDKEGEPLEETAKRELKEETGYLADEIHLVQEGPYNSGLSADKLAIFYAPNVTFVGKKEGDGDATEEIDVMTLPLDELVDFCTKKHADYMVDIKIPSTLKILEHRGVL